MSELVTDKKKYTLKINSLFIKNFMNKFTDIFSKNSYESILDIGCGEGAVLNYLNKKFKLPSDCHGIDLSEKEIEMAKKNIPFCTFKTGSIYELPYENNRFDLVICTEVLEHLENPLKAMEEISRVASNFVILSVPREPLWRILNLMRLKYVNDLGNTPDHRNHWSTKEFKKFVNSRFSVEDVKQPIPWTIVLGKKN